MIIVFNAIKTQINERIGK